MIHVWHVYLHLVDFYGKCRHTIHRSYGKWINKLAIWQALENPRRYFKPVVYILTRLQLTKAAYPRIEGIYRYTNHWFSYFHTITNKNLWSMKGDYNVMSSWQWCFFSKLSPLPASQTVPRSLRTWRFQGIQWSDSSTADAAMRTGWSCNCESEKKKTNSNASIA